MYIRHLLSIALFLTLANMLSAQDDFFKEEALLLKHGTFGRVELGGTFLNLSELNHALEGRDYLGIPEAYFSMGIGLSRLSKGWILEGDMYNYMIAQSNFNNQLAVLGYHYGQVGIGYTLYRKENEILVYPLIGIGGGLANLKDKPADKQFPKVYRTAGWMGNASLNVRYLSEMQDDKGMLIELGFQIGYLYTGPSSGFNLKRWEPDSVVNINPGGFYFRLSLGMGKMR